MTTISPERYPQLTVGKTYRFIAVDGSELGRLLYAWTRRNYYDPDDEAAFHIVQHRCGYEPTVPRSIELRGETLAVESIHLGAGRFRIEEV